MSYLTRSRLFLSAMLLSGGLSPVQAGPTTFPVQAWTYATVGLTTAQAPTATTRRVPDAAALTDGMQASSDPRTTVLPELAPESSAPLSTELTTPLGLLSEHMRQWMAQALTPGQVARTLSSFGSTGAGGMAGNMAQSLIDQGWNGLEEKLRGDFFRSINLNWRPGYGGREDILQIDTVMSLWDRETSSIFGQAGLQSRDGEGGLHVGLGYRARPVEAVLLGLNIFYDYLSDPEVSRYSLGAEAQTVYGGVSANWYQGLSDERLSDGRIAYSPDGFDIEFSGRMPGLPYLELTGRYYRWNGQGAGARDLEGTEYGLKLTPVPLFTVKGVYEDLSGGGDDVGVEASIEYRFGVPWQEQLRSSAVASRSDPWQRRFERVRRQYEQRVRYIEGSGKPSVMAQTPRLPSGGVRLVFTNVPAEASNIRIRWASTAAPDTQLGMVMPRSDSLTPVNSANRSYSYELTQANSNGFTFDPNISYRFTAEFLAASGTVLATDTDESGGEDFFAEISSPERNTLRLRWPRQTGAQSARLSWRRHASTLGVSTASGVVPLVENEDITLDYAMICPPTGMICTYTIRGLQPGAQYTVTLEIYSGEQASGTRLSNASVTVTIDAPTLSVAAAPGAIQEGQTSTITITASTAPSDDLTIPYTIAGTNIEASDYTLTDASGTELTGLTGNVTLPATQTSVALTLTAADDADASAETLTLALTAVTGYTLATSTATITITPMGVTLPALSVAAAPTAIQEGQTSTITITASTAPSGNLTIPYTIAGTNIEASDYTLTSGGSTLTGLTGNITLSGSATSVALTLTAADDADISAEMLTFTLNTPGVGAAYTLATSTATITINPLPSLPVLSVAAAPGRHTGRADEYDHDHGDHRAVG